MNHLMGGSHCSANTTFPTSFIVHPIVDHVLDLRFNILTVESHFPNYYRVALVRLIILTIPPNTINAFRETCTFHNQTDCIFVAPW